MAMREIELNPLWSPSRIQKELEQFPPQYCPNCGGEFLAGQVKNLPTENNEQVRWSTFCGFCGGIYTVEIEA
jgi:ribosomal protein S27AE